MTVRVKYTMKYYSALKKKKKKEVLPFMTTWTDLEDIMLSEINQTQKNKYCMILVICGIQIDS